MNILLLGSGGREHALAWKLKAGNTCNRLLIAPGNAGTAKLGTNLALSVIDFEAIADACIREKIDMLIVGPEEPLVKGIADDLHKRAELKDLLIIGPSAGAAQLEGSKAFAKAFMERHQIPTATYREFTEANFEEGIDYLKSHPLPIVLKADGLAAGKGVIICHNHIEAIAEFEYMIQYAKFGEAGKKVVVEAFLDGIEVSVFVLTDGNSWLLLPEAKDYKKIGEGDKGLNTGGMGAISPVPFADAVFMDKVKKRIIEPTVKGLQKEKLDYRGFIFFGLISVQNEPMVIEYNCRLGDPETEAIIPRIKTDLVPLLEATAKQKLHEVSIELDERHAATFVAVSQGYPGAYESGLEISGLTHENDQALVFYAGIQEKEGLPVTAGGRVVCTTGLAPTLTQAIALSRAAMDEISYEGKYYRRDIGYEFK